MLFLLHMCLYSNSISFPNILLRFIRWYVGTSPTRPRDGHHWSCLAGEDARPGRSAWAQSYAWRGRHNALAPGRPTVAWKRRLQAGFSHWKWPFIVDLPIQNGYGLWWLFIVDFTIENHDFSVAMLTYQTLEQDMRRGGVEIWPTSGWRIIYLYRWKIFHIYCTFPQGMIL